MKAIMIGMRWADVYDLMYKLGMGGKYRKFTAKLEAMYTKEFGTKVKIDWLD